MVLVLSLLFSGRAGAQAGIQPGTQDMWSFLRERIKLTNEEIGGLQRGKTISKVLPSENHEVAVFGIVLVNAPADFFVERFRDIESYKKSTAVPIVKKFSDPPSIVDLAQLEVDQQDFDALKNCKVGACDVKLPAQIIERLQKEVNWTSRDAPRQVNWLARSALLEYVKRYIAGGNAALSEYNDKEKPLRIAEEFDAILEASPYIYDYQPQFYEYLRAYPEKHLENVENFIYWSKEKFGLKPVISVTHVSIYRPEPGLTLIASKQLYASHYFEASLGLTVARAAPQSPGTGGPSFYLLYLNRSRSDALHGGFSGMVRGKVKDRSRKGAQESLEKIKLSVERLWKAITAERRNVDDETSRGIP